MDIGSAVSLFFAMTVLALLPGPGILVVISRTASNGFMAGATTTLGIVAGDFVFIFLAVSGLSFLAAEMGEYFLWVKYLGAAYLIWLGLNILLSKEKSPVSVSEGAHTFNFLAGLITTLSNPKAILFYVSFFPAFIDLTAVNFLSLSIILIITALAVGGVMLMYAYTTARAGHFLTNRLSGKKKNLVKYGSGSMLIGSGVYLATKS